MSLWRAGRAKNGQILLIKNPCLDAEGMRGDAENVPRWIL